MNYPYLFALTIRPRYATLLVTVALLVSACSGASSPDALEDSQALAPVGEQDETDENGLGSNEAGDMELGDTEVGNTEIGDTEIGDTEVGDTEIGDTEIGDTEVGDTELGDTEIGDTEIGGPDVSDPQVRDPEFDDSVDQPTNDVVAIDLPDNCIVDRSPSGETFCYQQDVRVLQAWASNGNPWWSFVLPGSNDENAVHAIQVVNGKLIIVAEQITAGEQSGFEVSTFSLSGEFEKTHSLSLDQNIDGNDRRIAGPRIQVADIGSDLIVVGDYGLQASNIMPSTTYGTFSAVFDTNLGIVADVQYYNELQQTNSMQVSGNQITLELNNDVFVVTPDDLQLKNAIGSFQSLPINRANYLQKKQRVIYAVQNIPFQQLYNRVFGGIDFSTSIDRPYSAPIECDGGGQVIRSLVNGNVGNSTRTISYNNCVMDEYTVNGVFTTFEGIWCGRDCFGPQLTQRFTDFSVTFANGDSMVVDGEVATEERRITYSRTEGQIENPVTYYINTTTLNSFYLSNDRLTIDLSAGQYEYEGYAKHGTGTWLGSGTLSFADGVTETFSVDMTRTVLHGIQTEASGLLEVNRSDGTSLRVEPGISDISKWLYSVTTADDSIQLENHW